jgi:CheY-like chemotaxis protein
MAKILLVEDDNNLREIYEARLQAEGYDIVAAHDGEEALVVAKNETPDLIISDVMMPKISGFEMLDILRNTDGLKDVKIIMLTALGQSDDQQRADRLGANRYLVKSQVTLEDIVKVAQELLTEGNEPAPTNPPIVAATPPVVTIAPPVEPVASAAIVQPEPVEPAVADVPTPTEPTIEVAPMPIMTLASPPVDEPTTPSLPVSDDSVATSQAPSSDALLTTAEEANVEAQIEDFVQGASTEATPTSPESAVTPQPALAPTDPVASEQSTAPIMVTPSFGDPSVVVTPEPPAPASEPTASSDSATDDKLINDAVDTFAENTSVEPAPLVAPSQSPVPATPAIVVSPGLPTPTVTEVPGLPVEGVTAPASPAVPDSNAQFSVARKKVIEPIGSINKPDLSALLARETANEARPDTVIAPAPPAPINDGSPVTVVAPAPGPTNPNPPPAIDPNSIAL